MTVALLVTGLWLFLILLAFGLCRSAAKGDRNRMAREARDREIRRTPGGWRA